MSNNLAYKEEENFLIPDLSPSYVALSSQVIRTPNEILKTKNNAYPYLLLFSLICLDGFLTYLGVAQYGTEVEGNYYLREFMEIIGAESGLLLVKASSFILLTLLWTLRNKINWLTKAVCGMSVVYFAFAVLPWTYLLVFI